jgi:WD40-like Beta Propeller Repeat
VLLAVGVGVAYGNVSSSCPNEQLRSENNSTQLPDCRAYEMVSPLEKGGHGVSFAGARAAVSGEAITYLSVGAFAEPKGIQQVDRYLSRRSGSGWSTSNISPANVTYETQTLSPFEELVFTPELSMGVLESEYAPLVGGELAGYYNFYVWSAADGSYQTVTTVKSPSAVRYTEKQQPVMVGASSDLSHVVFEQNASLVEGAAPGYFHVYEWADGRLSRVDIPPAGDSFEGGRVGPPQEQLGGERFPSRGVWHAVSADGSRVFFSSYPPQRSGGGQLYVRENPMAVQSPVEHGVCTVSVDACTVEVSASQRVTALGEPAPDPHGPQPAFFKGASVDGSLVFFVSRAELTNDANTGPEDNARNLYAYDLATGKLTDLTVDSNPGDVNGAAVVGFVTAAEDGSYVYFVANGVLAGNASGSLAETAKPGDCPEGEGEVVAGSTCNLYVEHFNGSVWEVPRFVATLAGGADEDDWFEKPSIDIVVDYGPGQHRVRVTPDGTRLAFQSVRGLTGYDNAPAEPDACEDERCSEVYLYDAVNGALTCVSCDPGGARPVGRAELGASFSEAGEVSFGEAPSQFYTANNLSVSGGRLFFQSPDALVPQASGGLQNVYEWEADGVGSCAQASGCVAPVSDVSGPFASYFMDASPSGEDVFIATADQLVPSDTDNLRDVYDVRVDGGFPAPAAAVPCEAAGACRGSLPAQPANVLSAPASATFAGTGNLAAPPPVPAVKPRAKKVKACARGDARKRGRCVRQKARKRARRSSVRARSEGRVK